MATAISFKRNATAATSAAPTQAAAPAQVSRPAAPAFVPPAPAQQPAQQPVQQAPAAVQEPVAAPAAAPVTANVPAVVNSNSQLAVAADYLPAVAIGEGGIGGFEGEWTARDMAVPYLSLLQKTSPNFDAHPDWLGQFIFDKEFPLGTEIVIVAIRASKYLLENLPYGDTQIPKRFTKVEDAKAAGFTADKLVDVADIDLLIELDANIEGISDIASIVVDDKAYLMARYSVRSSSFKVARILMKDASGWLRGNLLNGKYVLSSGLVTSGKNSWYAPTLKAAGPTSTNLRREVLELFGLNEAA